MYRIIGALWMMLTAMLTGGTMAEPHIQQLTTPKGITLWLVESHQIPMVSVEVAFRSGSAFEPAAKAGLANLTATMLTEGAGELDARAFAEALDEIGARMGADADKLDSSLSLTTLSDHKARAFELMGLALNRPRFDAADVARVKAAIVAGIRQSEENPQAVASKAFMKTVFGGHAYGRASVGENATVTALEAADIVAWHAAQYTRANMVVSMVGDVTPAEAVALVDGALAGLSAGSIRNAVAEAPAVPVARGVHTERDVPQAAVLVGHLGLPRDDPDYWALLVMNDMLGAGGGLSNRLFDVVREKNGLVYHVGSVNIPLPHAGVFFVQLQTENAKAQKALDLVKAELKRMQDTLPAADEFADTVDYLTGSFPLRIDSNAKILGYLTLMQMEGLGPDYLETWVANVRKVTPADVQRVAMRVLHPEAAVLSVVGQGPALKTRF